MNNPTRTLWLRLTLVASTGLVLTGLLHNSMLAAVPPVPAISPVVAGPGLMYPNPPVSAVPTAVKVVVTWAEAGIAYRRPDSDKAGNRFRTYEVAGMPHNNSRETPGFQNDPCTLPVTDFPAGAFTALGLNHLISWIEVPLQAELVKKLYDGKEDYVRKANTRLTELVAAGWLLPEYVEAIQNDLRATQLP